MRLTKFHWITLLIFAFVVCLISASVQAYDPDSTDAYVFPEMPKMRGTNVDSLMLIYSEQMRLSQVPDSLLKTMSTEGLIETCLNYPFFESIVAYSNLQEGFENIVSKFNGLQELLQREDVDVKLMERYKKADPEAFTMGEELNQKRDYTKKRIFYVEVLIAQNFVLSNLEKEKRKELLQICLEKIPAKKRHPEIYGESVGLTWFVVGRILQKESFDPFMEELKENGKLKEFIEDLPISFRPDTSSESKNVMTKIASYAEQFVHTNSGGK